MTDKEILAEVYKMCCNPFERCDVKSFIEEEWQRQDEQELVDQYNRNRKPEDWVKDVKDISPPPSWVKDEWYHSYPPVDPCTNDIKEIERHRGLEIGEDGTVGGLF